MKLPGAILYSVLLVSLNGCAYLTSFRSDLVSQVDEWIKEQEYGQVLATIEFIKPTHPQYKILVEKKKKVIPLIVQMEKQLG